MSSEERAGRPGVRAFEHCNLFEVALDSGPAHDGKGQISFARVAARDVMGGACNFIDYAEIHPGSTIGLHRHGHDEEEFYLVLSGEGEMSSDGVTFPVRAGDLIRNRPGGEHGLWNLGTDVMRLFVFELRVPA